MKTFLFLIGLFVALTASQAEAAMRAMRSTPDISVSSTATATIPAPDGTAEWVSIKNDCADALYFDLRQGRDDSANRFPLRLELGETFTAAIRLNAVSVSAESSASGTCTFTIQFAR